MFAYGEPIELTQENIYKFIEQNGGTSFIEIMKYFPDAKGKYTYGDTFIDNSRRETNFFYWGNVSIPFMKIMTVLMKQEDSFITDSSPDNYLIYGYDGGGMDLPVYKGKIKYYKEDQWVPLVFYIDKEIKKSKKSKQKKPAMGIKIIKNPPKLT